MQFTFQKCINLQSDDPYKEPQISLEVVVWLLLPQPWWWSCRENGAKATKRRPFEKATTPPSGLFFSVFAMLSRKRPRAQVLYIRWGKSTSKALTTKNLNHMSPMSYSVVEGSILIFGLQVAAGTLKCNKETPIWRTNGRSKNKGNISEKKMLFG